MVINDPLKFKDSNNYPKAWKCDSSKKAGVSAINISLDLSFVKSSLGKENIDLIKHALGKYINELTPPEKRKEHSSPNKVDQDKKEIETESNHDSDEELDSHEQQLLDEVKRGREANKSLHNKIEMLEIKAVKLLEILSILTQDSPQNKALVNVSIDILDMLS